MMLAQIPITITATPQDSGGSPWAPVLLTIIAGLLVLIPLIFGLIRGKIEKAKATAEAEAARAQAEAAKAKLEALDTQKKLEQAQLLRDAVVRGVEKITSPLDETKAKETKGVFTALAEEMGVREALEETVGHLGFSRAKSRPDIQTPKE